MIWFYNVIPSQLIRLFERVRGQKVPSLHGKAWDCDTVNVSHFFFYTVPRKYDFHKSFWNQRQVFVFLPVLQCVSLHLKKKHLNGFRQPFVDIKRNLILPCRIPPCRILPCSLKYGYFLLNVQKKPLENSFWLHMAYKLFV